MGISKTICYCANRRCKSRYGKEKNEPFDMAHWEEIKDNLNRYLKEDICVPGASDSIKVPAVAIELLNAVLKSLVAIQNCKSSDASQCLYILSNALEAVARLSYLCHQINSAPFDGELRVSRSLRVLTEDTPDTMFEMASTSDRYLEVGVVIVKATHRAIYELLESKRLKDDAYIFHHLAIVLDSLQELNRLIVDAMAQIGSERFLPVEHKHQELLEERWQEDGI